MTPALNTKLPEESASFCRGSFLFFVFQEKGGDWTFFDKANDEKFAGRW